MIVALDEIVGQLIAHLEKHNLLENTLIIFTSDNGAALYSETVTNYPLSGGKMTLYEGGVNVPLILYKKNDFPKQKVVTAPVTLLDIFVTITDMLQLSLPEDREYDGKSLLPWIYEAPSKSPHEHIFWLSDYNYAIRNDQFKLIINDMDKTIFLYDLLADKSELNNLATENPAIVEAMKSAVQEWMALMPPLHWPRIMDYTVEINGKVQRWAV
jgi:arylsulfatase A-like enzyme